MFPDFAELALMGGNLAFEEELLEQAQFFYHTAREHGSAGAVVGLENVRRLRAAESSGNLNSSLNGGTN
jgi:hypothetical protein